MTAGFDNAESGHGFHRFRFAIAILRNDDGRLGDFVVVLVWWVVVGRWNNGWCSLRMRHVGNSVEANFGGQPLARAHTVAGLDLLLSGLNCVGSLG